MTHDIVNLWLKRPVSYIYPVSTVLLPIILNLKNWWIYIFDLFYFILCICPWFDCGIFIIQDPSKHLLLWIHTNRTLNIETIWVDKSNLVSNGRMMFDSLRLILLIFFTSCFVGTFSESTDSSSPQASPEEGNEQNSH